MPFKDLKIAFIYMDMFSPYSSWEMPPFLPIIPFHMECQISKVFFLSKSFLNKREP